MNIQVIENDTQRILKFGPRVGMRMEKDGSFSLDFYTQLMYSFYHVGTPINKICILGLGAGCLHRHIFNNYPNIQIDTVEILPELIDIAREKFYLPVDNRIRIFIEDASTWIKRYSGYDIVMVDLYNEDGQVSVDDNDLKKLGKLIVYNSLVNKHTYENYIANLREVYTNVYEQFKPELNDEECNHVAFCQ